MKKLLLLLLLCPSIALASVFNSAQVGANPVNGYYLQTNGSISTWASVSGGSSTFGTTSISALFPLFWNTSTAQMTFGGLSTSSAGVIGNIPYFSGVNTFANVGTTTLTASSPLTGSFTQIGSGGTLGCQTASGSQAGCLSSTDWNTFNGKGSGTVTAVTATFPIASSGGTTPVISSFLSTTTNNNWSGYNVFTASTTIGNGTNGGGLTIYGTGTTTNLIVLASSTLQNFTAQNSTSTNATSTSLYVSGNVAVGQNVTANNFIDSSTGGSTCIGETGGLLQNQNCVASIASSGNTITVSSPTGAVNIDFNLAHGNVWTASSTFNGGLTMSNSTTTNATTTGSIEVGNDVTSGRTVSANSFTSTGSSIPLDGFTQSAANVLSFYTNSTLGLQITSGQGLMSFASTTLGGGSAGTGLTVNGTATSTNLILISSSTLQAFTGTNATTTNATTTTLNITGNVISIGAATGYISATSTISGAFASSTLDAMGKSIVTGTTTRLIMNPPTAIKLTGFTCVASTTGVAIIDFSHDNGNKTESAVCNSSGNTPTFTPIATNNTFTGFEDLNAQASSTAGTTQIVNFSLYYIKTQPQ